MFRCYDKPGVRELLDEKRAIARKEHLTPGELARLTELNALIDELVPPHTRFVQADELDPDP